MSLGLAVLLLGMLFLFVFHAAFRRFVLWTMLGLFLAAVIGVVILKTADRSLVADRCKQMFAPQSVRDMFASPEPDHELCQEWLAAHSNEIEESKRRLKAEAEKIGHRGK
jgi:hypothetical protein